MAKKDNIVFYGTGRRKNAIARVRIMKVLERLLLMVKI